MKPTGPRRLMALILCLAMMVGPLSGLLLLTPSAAVIEDDDKLALTIQWAGSTSIDRTTGLAIPYKEGNDYYVSFMVSARTKNGNTNKSTTVTVATMDLSARTDLVNHEYQPIGDWAGYETFTLRDGQSKTFKVKVWNQKKYGAPTNSSQNKVGISGQNYASNTTGYGVTVNGVTYYRQFAVQILRHDANAYISGERTIRSFVRSANGGLATLKNSDIAFFSDWSGSWNEDMHDKGYSYAGSATNYTNTSFTYRSNSGKTHMSGSKYLLLHNRNSDGDDIAWFMFNTSPWNYLKSQSEPSKLMNYFDTGLNVYVAGSFQHDATGGTDVIHANGLEYTIYEYNGTTDDGKPDLGTNLERHTIGENRASGTRRWPQTSNGNSTDFSRGGYSSWFHMPWDKRDQTLLVRGNNQEGDASGYNKRMWDLKMTQILLNNNGPKIEEIYISQTLITGSRDEDLFLMVRFDQPVQLYSISSNFQIRTSAGGNNDIVFKYLDGNYTDTLIFKANLQDEAANLNYDSLTVKKFENIPNGAGLFMTTSNNNPGVNWEKYSNDKDIEGTVLDCVIDTRTPALSVSYDTTGNEFPTSYAKSHKVELTITNMVKDENAEVRWAFTTNRDINQVDANSWTKVSGSKLTADLSVPNKSYLTIQSPTTLSGEYYLHIQVTSRAGQTVRETLQVASKQENDKKFRFDNTAPVVKASSYSGDGQTHTMFLNSHKIVLDISDKHSGQIQSVSYEVFGLDGVTALSGLRQIYPTATESPGAALRAVKDHKGLYEMDLSVTDACIPKGEYGGYTVRFTVTDAAGNTTVYTLPDELMFDNRDRFAVTVTPYENSYMVDKAYPIADGLGDYPIYYTTYDYDAGGGQTAKGKLYIEVKGESSVENKDNDYSLYSVAIDGKTVYTAADGWAPKDGRAATGTDYGLNVLYVRTDGIDSYFMRSGITFDSTAAGRYEFIYVQNNQLQSEIVTVCVTPEDAETTNYKNLYDAERLLVNRVWQFATNRQYKVSMSQATYYDGSSSVDPGQKPIFSSPEKALDYAIFTELQDIQLVTITSDTVAANLNSGVNTTYRKAAGETVEAVVGQTWIRYKSIDWSPTSSGNSNTVLWVYYFYSNSAEQTISAERADSFQSLFYVNELLYNALLNNAKEIANLDPDPDRSVEDQTGGWIYLTRNTSTGYVDQYGQPTYSKKSIFYDPAVIPAGSGAFEAEMSYSGDPEIYDSFVDVMLDTDLQSIPLVGNYTFTVDSYSMTAFRPWRPANEIQADWVSVTNGQTLRSAMPGSGIYEIKELGGGFRKYLVYCDFDAPSVRYGFLEAGAGGEFKDSDAERFDATHNGNTFRAKSITLKHIVDTVHAISGASIEMDAYSYIYLTQNAGAGLAENVIAFFPLKDFNAGDDYKLPDGVYKLYVYDRLGNGYTLNINVNESPLILPDQEPVVTENTSVTFRFNREKNQIAKFSITRVGETSQETDTDYQKVKTYVKSGTYSLYIEDIFGNIETRTITLERDPPTLDFFFKNGSGQFEKMQVLEPEESTPQGMASVKRQTDEVYTITSSTTVRIGYSAYAKYQYKIEPEGAPYKEITTSTHKYIEIPVTDVRWTLTISYANDEETKVTITCINDAEPPTVTAEATVPVYTFAEEAGHGNVLFADTGTSRKVSLPSGSKANAEEVIFRWDDGPEGSGVEVVTYTFNGGEIQKIDPKDPDVNSQFRATTPGTYVLTVMDLLDNKTVFEFTIAEPLDFSGKLADGTLMEYPAEPLDSIEGSGAGAVFTETTYTGKAFSLLLGEDMQLTLARTVDGATAIHRVEYKEGHMILRTLESDGSWNELTTVTLSADTAAGSADVLGFPMAYEKDKNGLHLEFADNDLPLELWQFRANDFAASTAYILQVERSNRLPTLTPIKLESEQSVVAGDQTFTGINEAFTLRGDTSDIISIVAYRSARFTEDFSGTSAANTLNLWTAGLIGSAEDEGYYKVIITNKYGNQQVFLLRVNFGADVDVVLLYDDFDNREHTLAKSGTYPFYTNKSIVVRVWNLDAKLTITDAAGQAYNPVTRMENGCIELTFKHTGTYSVSIKDDFGNDIRLELDIKSPATLAYGDYLTGFNRDAVYADKQYTNAPVSLSRDALDAAGIAYVAYESTADKSRVVLYDVISQDRVDYTAANFERSIGQKNGTYRIIFADRYGNPCETEVRVSDKNQLYVSRQTKNSAGNMDYAIADVVANGVYSNYLVRLRNEAEAYRLLVDGEAATFDGRGEYISELPLSLGDTAEDTHTVVYIDEYGNRVAFTIHLLRRTPVIETLTDGEEVIRNNIIHVKGSFGFGWTDPTVTARYTRDGDGARPYTKEAMLAEDGTYTFTFTDIAGNLETRRIRRDTRVVFALMHGSESAFDGIAVSGQIRIAEQDEAVIITEVLRDGEVYAHEGKTFREHGSYVVTLSDEVGNTATIRFDIFNRPMQAFTYTSKGEYALYQVWQYIEGNRQPANGILLGEDGYQEFHFYEDGTYDVDLLHIPTNTYVTYSLEIDNIAPDVRLAGDITDGVTRNNVTLEGLSSGDIVEVWSNGVLQDTYRISSSLESPEISRAGDYRIVIRDAAGNRTELTFTREFTTNTASNILICMMLIGGGLGFALLLHKRGRIRIK